MIINIDELREDLIDYYGSATPFMPMAFMDVVKVENASNEELINIARKNGIDLNKYEVSSKIKLDMKTSKTIKKKLKRK